MRAAVNPKVRRRRQIAVVEAAPLAWPCWIEAGTEGHDAGEVREAAQVHGSRAGRKREGKTTKTGMSEEKLEKYASKDKKKS